MIVANNRNRTIKKGEQLFITYGKRNNHYLLAWYGFSFLPNIYDSLNFKIDMTKLRDAASPDGMNIRKALFYKFVKHEEYEHGVYIDPETKKKLNLQKLSIPFKSKPSKLDIAFVNFIRCQLILNTNTRNNNKINNNDGSDDESKN